jgi:hypothetical protein
LRTNEKLPVISEGHNLLRRLFQVAERRLQERGISMRSSPAVLEWLLNQSDWRSGLNPLRTLDGFWHKQVAAVIEGLLLEGQLRSGNILDIIMVETPSGFRIQFDIARPT